jgi:hypothetical protein
VTGAVSSRTGKRTAPTVKQHLAAIRMLFDWFCQRSRQQVSPVLS